MTIATYSDLQTAIGTWTHRTDLASVAPDLITLAEQRINGDLDARLQDTTTTLTTTASVATVTAPTDVVNIRSLTVVSSPNVALDYLTPDQFSGQYAYQESGLPQSFTVIGSLIYFGPIPDAVYSVTCVYKARIPALSNSNTTNWLLTNYPHVYLMATISEAAKYAKNTDLLAIAEKGYADAIKSVNTQDWYSGSTMRVRHDLRM